MPRMLYYDMGCAVPQLNLLRSLSSINLTGQAEFRVENVIGIIRVICEICGLKEFP